MKKLALHIISILLYFPIVVFMFLYLVIRPNKMTTFYFGLEALTNILQRKEHTLPVKEK